MSVDAVVMVLQLLLGRVRRPTTASLRRVTCHGRRRRTEPEGEAERFAHDAPKAASERDVDDEVDRRVDDHEQFADDGQV